MCSKLSRGSTSLRGSHHRQIRAGGHPFPQSVQLAVAPRLCRLVLKFVQTTSDNDNRHGRFLPSLSCHNSTTKSTVRLEERRAVRTLMPPVYD